MTAIGSTTADRTCAACADGTYSASNNAPSCSNWSNCSAGSYVSTAPSASNNRLCTTCSGGFSTTMNASMCTPWTTCNAGQRVLAAGGTTTDRTCMACSTGTYTTTTNAASCASWTTCNTDTVETTRGSTTADRVCASLTWSSQFGSSVTDEVRSVAIDASGNVYVAGTTVGTLPGETTAGGQDAFVRKYSAAGVEQWTVQFGTTAVDVAEAVGFDASGNVYVAGSTAGTFAGQSNAGSQDAFVRKYNSNGAEVWTLQFGTASFDAGAALAVDSSGNVVVAGQTSGTFAGQTNAGGSDGFARKLTSLGAVSWTREFGTADYDIASAVAVDASGNVFVAGHTYGNFGGTTAGAGDAYVRRLDASGNNPWTRQLGSIESDTAHAVATDASGNVFIAGEAEDALPGQSAISGNGSVDSFVAKYDSTGTLLWTRQFGTSTQDVVRGVTTDSSGNVVVAGYVSGTLTGYASPGGAYDILLRKYDGSGTEVWTRRLGSAGSDFAESVAIVGGGNVAVAGYTQGTLTGQTSAGGTDAFAIVAPP